MVGRGQRVQLGGVRVEAGGTASSPTCLLPNFATLRGLTSGVRLVFPTDFPTRPLIELSLQRQ